MSFPFETTDKRNGNLPRNLMEKERLTPGASQREFSVSSSDPLAEETETWTTVAQTWAGPHRDHDYLVAYTFCFLFNVLFQD